MKQMKRPNTSTFLKEQDFLAQFRGGLCQTDQLIFDDLLASTQQHFADVISAAGLSPHEGFLLAMFLENHRELMHLEALMESLLVLEKNEPPEETKE